MSDKLIKYLAKREKLRTASPSWLRKIARKILPVNRYNKYLWAEENPYIGTQNEVSFSGSSVNKLGIIFDPAQYHKYYMTACIDMDISYEVIDIRRNDWLDKVNSSGCSAILIWPLITSNVLKEMVDERIKIIEENLCLPVYPPSNEVWLLDNKRRVTDWLKANGFSQPRTDCFFIEEEAIEFAKSADYPLVFKTTQGSVSRGVKILHNSNDAMSIIRKAFSKGIVQERSDPRNFQWDFVMFQEYLPDVEEKRMIRIGDSFICIDKVRVGDFHSGSGYMKWGNPEEVFLNLTKDLTDKGDFKSMNVDFFISKDGRILVNELHTLFHGPQIPDSDLKGRYIYKDNKWDFEKGSFYRNYCCNLRVKHLLQILGEESDFEKWIRLPAF